MPTAHDEEPLQFDAYREVFERPAALLVNSEEELALIDRRFPRHARARVVGVGVDAPTTAGERFRKRFGIDGSFLLYVGRVERGKGIPELLDRYARLRRGAAEVPELVLAGESSMAVAAEGVRVLGRIEEQEKWDGLSAAAAVVVPSAKESLSLLALEAFAVGTPVVGNAASAVVAGHLERSGAGAAYRDAESFAGAVAEVAAHGANCPARHGARPGLLLGTGGGCLPRGDGAGDGAGMKLIGRDIDPRELLRAARARLEARGLRDPGAQPAPGRSGAGGGAAVLRRPEPGAERGPHRAASRSSRRNRGSGRGVAMARRLFRRTAQVFIDEALGRQRVFNGRVRDLSAQLAAEVLRLRARVEALESERTKRPALPGRDGQARVPEEARAEERDVRKRSPRR